MATAYDNLILAEPTLASYWPMDNKSTADLKGSNTLTYTGCSVAATPLIPADPLSGVVTNGSSDFAQVNPLVSALPTGKNPWTLEMAIKTTSAVNGDALGFGAFSGTQDVDIRTTSAGALALNGHTNSTTFGGTVNEGVLHLVALTYDSSHVLGYIDGLVVGSPYAPTAYTIPSGVVDIGVAGAFWAGTLGKVAIYTSALTTSLLAHYQAAIAGGAVFIPRNIARLRNPRNIH